MITISVTSNVEAVLRSMQDAAKTMPAAAARALNKTADQAKVAASKEVRAVGYNLKASVIKNGIRIRRATNGNLSASVVASGRPIPLIEYGATDRKPNGVSVKVLKGRKTIKEAFIVTMPNGHRAVCVRQPGAKAKKVHKLGRVAWEGLPIRQLYGPALPDAMANKVVEVAITAAIREKFPRILAHEHEWLRRNLKR